MRVETIAERMQSDIDHFEINVLPLKPEPPPEALAVPLLNLGDSFLPLCTTELSGCAHSWCRSGSVAAPEPPGTKHQLTTALVSTVSQELLTARSSRGRGRAASVPRRGRRVLVSGWVVGVVSRLMSAVLDRSQISQPATTATARLLLKKASHCEASNCETSEN